MNQTNRRRTQAWTGTILTVLIAVSAGAGIIRLRDRSDARREGQLLLSRVELAASRQTLETLNILGLGVSSRGKSQTSLNVEVERVSSKVKKFGAVGYDALAQLDRLGFGGTSVHEAAAAFDRLQREIDVALSSLADGQHGDAYIYGMRRIQPTFDRIDRTMGVATAFYGREARRAHVLTNAGGVATLLAAMGLLFVLRRRLSRERRCFQIRLEHEALHDPLTDLPNRRLFKDRLERSCSRKVRGHGTGVMFIDLDGFKAVNDSKGHDAGDRLLQSVAERLKTCVREVDTVARIGGDEFAVVLSDVTQPVETVGIANRILESLGRPFEIAGVTVQIGASIGIAILNTNESPEDLCTRADTAMYAAKRSGRGAYRIAPGRTIDVRDEPARLPRLATVGA